MTAMNAPAHGLMMYSHQPVKLPESSNRWPDGLGCFLCDRPTGLTAEPGGLS